MKLLKAKKKLHGAFDANKGDKNWCLFDYTIIIANLIFIRAALSKELWYQTLQKNGAKLFKIFSIDIEQDKDDDTLKLYSLTILGLILSIAFVTTPKQK